MLFLDVVQHLLDFRRAEGGAEEMFLIDIDPPQPLAQLVQLLHAHGGQLTGKRAALQQTHSGLTHK